MVIRVEWNTCELRFGPRSQADIVVAEKLLVKLSLSALSAIYPFGGQASLHVTHTSAIVQLVSAEFCILAANVPVVALSAEAFVRPAAVARPTVISMVMRFYSAAEPRLFCYCVLHSDFAVEG